MEFPGREMSPVNLLWKLSNLRNKQITQVQLKISCSHLQEAQCAWRKDRGSASLERWERARAVGYADVQGKVWGRGDNGAAEWVGGSSVPYTQIKPGPGLPRMLLKGIFRKIFSCASSRSVAVWSLTFGSLIPMKSNYAHVEAQFWESCLLPLLSLL